MTDLGLAALPKGVTEITVRVVFEDETHTFPMKVSR